MFEADVDNHDDGCADDGFGESAKTAQAANSSGTPYGCSSGETFDCIAVLEDDSGAKETNTGNDLRNDAGVVSPHNRG